MKSYPCRVRMSNPNDECFFNEEQQKSVAGSLPKSVPWFKLALTITPV